MESCASHRRRVPLPRIRCVLLLADHRHRPRSGTVAQRNHQDRSGMKIEKHGVRRGLGAVFCFSGFRSDPGTSSPRCSNSPRQNGRLELLPKPATILVLTGINRPCSTAAGFSLPPLFPLRFPADTILPRLFRLPRPGNRQKTRRRVKVRLVIIPAPGNIVQRAPSRRAALNDVARPILERRRLRL